MPSIRIWTLESDNDAKAVECLANKLTKYMKLGQRRIYTAGKRKPSIQLEKAIQNFLKRDDYLILIIDRDGPRAHHQRLQDPNSLINQIKRIVSDRRFAGKVCLVEAVQELEAWLLVDCIGVFCYYATKRSQYRENCRNKVSADPSLKRLIVIRKVIQKESWEREVVRVLKNTSLNSLRGYFLNSTLIYHQTTLKMQDTV